MKIITPLKIITKFFHFNFDLRTSGKPKLMEHNFDTPKLSKKSKPSKQMGYYMTNKICWVTSISSKLHNIKWLCLLDLSKPLDENISDQIECNAFLQHHV